MTSQPILSYHFCCFPFGYLFIICITLMEWCHITEIWICNFRFSENPYLFKLILKIDDLYNTQFITYKITCARTIIEYLLSYLIISSRSFCYNIFFLSNQNVAESRLYREIHPGHNFWKDDIAKFIHITFRQETKALQSICLPV